MSSERGMTVAWELARRLDRDSSPWELEWMKACLDDRAEIRGGVGGIRHAIAVAVAVLVLLKTLLQWGGRSRSIAPNAKLVVAVHGEWSNRTRHLLSRVGHDLQPAAIVMLGRPEGSLEALGTTWLERTGSPMPPVHAPLSWAAARAAAGRLSSLLAEGWREARSARCRPPLREHAALVFRVLLGAIEAEWWRQNGVRDACVIFGHTGTADTHQLERQMQSQGCRTVHSVHGLCEGPNFVGFSTVAFFRSGADARLYGPLGQYGACAAPAAAWTEPLTGEAGLLLFTNLAHPMRAGYRERGIADEIAVLEAVSRGAQLHGQGTTPMRWKPHPTIDGLPKAEQQRLRSTARELGFDEITDWQAVDLAARAARWVLTTPSSMAVELLGLGRLPIVIGALEGWPGVACSAAEIAESMARVAAAAPVTVFRQAWERCLPARAPTADELVGRATEG